MDIVSICAEGGTRFNKRQSVTFILFLVGFSYSIVMIWLPEKIPGFTIIDNIGQGFWFVLILIIVARVKVDGESLINIDKDMGKAVNWGIVICVCAFTAIGTMISDEALGACGWLGNILDILLAICLLYYLYLSLWQLF